MKRKYVLFMAFVLLCLFSHVAFANSGPAPALIIIAQGVPEDTVITCVETGESANRQSLAWETYYVFQYGAFGEGFAPAEATIRVSGGGKSFEHALDFTLLRGYDAIVSLDFAAETFTPGKLPLRSALLIVLRLSATLVVESIIFFIFGFRQKRSWLYFLCVNIVTQAALSLWINTMQPLFSYAIFGFLGIEVLIFIAESIAFALLLKEHTNGRRVGYALLANLASLILGSYLLTGIPV